MDPKTYHLGLLWLRQAGCYLMLTSVQDSPKCFEMFSQVWAMAATRHKSWGKKCIFENSLNGIWNSGDINSHTLTRAQKVCWLKSERNDRLICYPECPRRAVSPPHTPALSPEAPLHCLHTLHLHVIAMTRARQNIRSPGRRASRGPRLR